MQASRRRLQRNTNKRREGGSKIPDPTSTNLQDKEISISRKITNPQTEMAVKLRNVPYLTKLELLLKLFFSKIKTDSDLTSY